MLAVEDAAVADNVNRKHAILVFGDDFGEYGSLVNDRAHGEGVIAWDEHEVGEGGVADIIAFDICVEGYVTLLILIRILP